MKIAHVVPVMTTVPPKKYGGIEEVVRQLALGQSRAGHKVAVFGAKGSKLPSPIKIIESSPYPTGNRLSENRKWELNEFLSVVSTQDQFDLLHFHYEPIISRTFMDGVEFNLLNFIHKPTVTTFHNITTIPLHISYYRKHRELWKRQFVFISNSHKKPLGFLPNSEVVYNGIPVEKFSLGKGGDYLLFLGRITKVKGIVEAIKAARLTGKKLIIAAKVDPTDKKYYEKEVKHLIDGKQIDFIGEVNFKEKVELYRNALCLLFPISWEEPFGLVLVESLACGTPVVGFARGSVPEIVANGKTGFVVKNVDEMVKAIGKIKEIDRKECRIRSEQTFSSKRMVEGYFKVYKKVLKK